MERARVQKRLLDGMQAALSLKALDGRDRLSGGLAKRNLTRAARRSRNQDSARAALPFSAAVLRSVQLEFIAQHVQERRVWRVADRISLAVDFNFDGHRHFSSQQKILRRIRACGKYRKRSSLGSVHGSAGTCTSWSRS